MLSISTIETLIDNCRTASVEYQKRSREATEAIGTLSGEVDGALQKMAACYERKIAATQAAEYMLSKLLEQEKAKVEE